MSHTLIMAKRTARTAANQTHAVVRADGLVVSKHVSEKLAIARVRFLNKHGYAKVYGNTLEVKPLTNS